MLLVVGEVLSSLRRHIPNYLAGFFTSLGIMVELKNVESASPEEKKQELYHWARMLAATEWEVVCMEAKGNPYMEAAKDEMEKINQSEMERYLYLRREMAISDEVSRIKSATNLGIRKGREEGREEGNLLRLISMVRKKYDKGRSPDETAEALEESVEIIQNIYHAIEENPDKTNDDLLVILQKVDFEHAMATDDPSLIK